MSANALEKDILRSDAGFGPLLQRDYWCVIDRCHLTPVQLIDWISHRFHEFPPHDRATFSAVQESLDLGDELEVEIHGAGRFRVRVIHRNTQSFTLASVRGHPEAGRITFGAYRNSRGDVIFHIRSLARSSARTFLVGFLAFGRPMQTHTWTDFVSAVACSAGEGVRGFIHAETQRLREEPEELRKDVLHPTFIATGEAS